MESQAKLNFSHLFVLSSNSRRTWHLRERSNASTALAIVISAWQEREAFHLRAPRAVLSDCEKAIRSVTGTWQRSGADSGVFRRHLSVRHLPPQRPRQDWQRTSSARTHLRVERNDAHVKEAQVVQQRHQLRNGAEVEEEVEEVQHGIRGVRQLELWQRHGEPWTRRDESNRVVELSGWSRSGKLQQWVSILGFYFFELPWGCCLWTFWANTLKALMELKKIC